MLRGFAQRCVSRSARTLPLFLGVIDQGHARELGLHLLQELEPLAVLGADERDAGDVAAGPRVAGHEAGLIGERHVREHDRNLGGHTLGGATCLRSRRADDVDVELDQLGGELGEAGRVAVRPSEFDREVLALDVAEPAEPLPERIEVRAAVVR